MRSFDIVLVNIGSLLGFFRWAVLILLVVLSFYLINKEKKIWKANLGIISLIFTVLLTPLLILEIIWKGPIEDDIAVVPNTSVENVTENPFSGVKPESPQNIAPSSGGVPSSHKNSSATDDDSSIAPVPEPTPTHHVVDVENATIENPSGDGKYEKGTLIKITANDKAGYHFDKWFSNDDDIKDKTDNPLEFDMPDGDLTIYPVYAPNTDTPYTVIHEKMNISGVYEEAETEHLTGTTDTNVTPATKSYEGFTTPDVQTKPVSGDGLMNITYQYKRNKYNFFIEHSDYIIEGDVSGEYYYEKSITVTAKEREDYNFVKWVNQDNQDVSTDASYTFNMPANDLTLYPVYEYVDPFPDSWSQSGKCIFEAYKDGNNKAHGLVKGDECAEYATANTGLEYIDTGLSLYSTENIDKDFEISFTIDHFAFDEQLAKNQETIFSAKAYDWGSGAQLRLLTTNDNLELIHRKDDDEHQGRKAVVLPIVDGQRITMMRYNGDFYYKVDNSAYVLMQENASEIMEGSFDLTAWIGAAPANVDGSEQRRFITGELSNIVLKLGENKTADFYEVTFAPNGGSLSYKLYYVQKGDAIGPLPTPTRSGYAFIGWFDSGGQEIISSTVPNGDITYTAHWVKDITQAKLADSQMDLVVGEASQQIRITNLDEIEPITFFSNNNSVATVDPETGLVTAVGAGETDIVITGYYSGITRTVHVASYTDRYTVTFDADGGSSVETMYVLPGSKISPIPSTTKEGHTFLGWFTERFGGGEELDNDTTIDNDITYWAYWDEGSSDVVLVCKKATDLHTETCLRGSGGCRAAGYSKDDTITYGTLPGAGVPQYSNAYNCDVNYDNKYDSVSERFYYLGQNGDNAVLVSHTNFEGSAGQKTTNIYLYNDALTMLPTTAQWSNPYLESFDGKPARFLTRAEVQTDCSNLNDCQFLMENTSFHIDDSAVSRTGLWLQKVNNTLYRINSKNRVSESVSSDSNNAARPSIEVPMEYIQVGTDVVVTFDYRDGRDNYERTLGPNEIVGELPHVENKEHAQFAGWFTAPDGGEQINKYTVPSGNVTYYAHWVVDTYIVTFMSEAGQYAQETVSHGSTVSSPADNPNDKTNYHFVEWRKQGESTAFDFTSAITEDITIEAYYEIDTHTVTFHSNGSVYGEPVTVNHGDTVSAPATDPTKQDYHFVKWVTVDGGSTAFDFASAIVADTDIYAEFAIDTYTVTFMSEGSQFSEFTNVEHGSKISAPDPAPTKEGYTFTGWRKSGESSDWDFANDTITGNTTLEAQFSINKYTVTFMSEGSQFSELTNVEHGSKISAPDPAPTKEGYTFTGWRKSGESSDWDFANDTITGNTTLEAQFESESVEPTYSCTLAEEGTLHQNECHSAYNKGCRMSGHTDGQLITYGQIASSSVPTFGDAYDCSIKLDEYDEPIVGRFYFLKKYDDYASLIYSHFFDGENEENPPTQNYVYGYSTALSKLPTVAQWTESNLIEQASGYAARFVYYDELSLCGTNLAGCEFILENTAFDYDDDYHRSGVWIDNTSVSGSNFKRIHTGDRKIDTNKSSTSENMAKPVIEVPYEYIEKVPAVKRTVSFDSDGGSPVADMEVDDGMAISSLPQAPTKAGNMFFGWYTDTTYSTEVTTSTIVTGDVTYYARWIENTSNFPIEFYQTDACVFDVGVVSGDLCNYRTEDTNKRYIDTGIALYSNENLGKDFEVGFTIVSYNASASATQSPFINAKGENTSGWPGFVVRKNNSGAEFTSRWNGTAATAISFTPSDGTRVLIRKVDDDVWVSVNDGQPQLLQNYGDTPTVLVNDIFVWFGASNKSGEPRYLSATLTDIYVKIGDFSDGTELTVTFDGNGGTPSETQVNVNSGEPIQNIPSVSRLNHHFDGWYDDPTGGNLVSDGITPITPSSNDTYYAHWTYEHSNEIVEYYSSSEAVREYFAHINTWRADETTLWSNLKSNFDGHKCMGPDKNDVSSDFGYIYDTTNAEEYCDRDIPFDTGFTSANIYLSDELTKAKGTQVSYTNSSTGKIYNMIPGQVYYYEDASDSSKYGYVKATNERRIMTVGALRNVRDLGGWSASGTNTLNGNSYTGVINYEYLFRGTELLSGQGNATALLGVGVTKQYELRTGTQSGEKMPNYKQTGLYNYDFAVDNSTRYQLARTAVTEIMKDVAYNDEKIYFHCTHGADRTGSVAYLLEGLLGVSEEDRNQEYELTTFSGQADKTRFYDHKGTGECGTGEFDPCKKYIYMQSYVRTNQEIYNWYTYNRTGADLDYDNQLIQDFRDKVLTYN